MVRIRLQHIISVISTGVFALLFCLTGCQDDAQPANRKVYVKKAASGYVLVKDGRPFIVKGASGHTNLAKLQEVGGNTIRTYDTTNLKAILDSAHAHGLSVIAGLPMPNSRSSISFYRDTASVGAQFRAFRRLVTSYRNHPALLIWCLGNELNITLDPRQYSFYRAYTNLLGMIKALDQDHPVTTSLINVQKRSLITIRLLISQLDFVSINTFGRAHQLQNDLDNFSWFWSGPFLLTEWGIHGPWEATYTAWSAPIEHTSTRKAQLHQQAYADYLSFKDGRCLGTLAFYWGYKQEKTHTWFSLFSEAGAATETVETLRYLWTGKQPATFLPKISHLSIDRRTAKENVILPANSVHTAYVFSKPEKSDNFVYRWEILPESRYTFSSTNLLKPKPIETAILSTTNSKAVFKTPAQEGPYRLFVEIVGKGNYATANFPFYVVQ